MAGSDHSGQDMEAGRTNRAENPTRIWAQQESGQPFGGDVIFLVEAARDIEDDDFVNASDRLHGILGAGVSAGAGVIGLSVAEVVIPPVTNVGVFGKGRTGVRGEGSPGVEGIGIISPPVDGLAGAGLLGRGGLQRPGESRRLHGPGVVGLGGSRSSGLSDAEMLVGGVGVFGQGAESEAERRPGAGVVGRGGSGGADDAPGAPGVVGLASGTELLGVMDPRDTGVFGQGGIGVTGVGTAGPGVRGVGGPRLTAASSEAPEAGVVGQGGSVLDPPGGALRHGPGVVGFGGEARALTFKEAGETGVLGVGKVGVKGVGTEGRGGVFVSERSAQVQLVPNQSARIVQQEAFIPTVASEPDRLGPSLPRAGSSGDLMALADDQDQCRLWFCVHGGTLDSPARWTQVLLGPAFDGR